MKNKHLICPVCNSEKIINSWRYYSENGLLRCRNCSFVFMEKIPTEDELNDFYSLYSYSAEAYLSPITIKSYNILLDEFEKYRKTSNLLDVGCGRGWFLEEAKKRGWKVFGTEYSDKAIEICSNKGIEMKKGELHSAEFKGVEFDIITSFEVIEHLSFPKVHL